MTLERTPLLVATLIMIGCGPAQSWQATYSGGSLSPELQNNALLGPLSAPQTQGVATARTVAYPSEHGVSLGSGWDLSANQKVYSTCVDFTAFPDNYQNADVSIQQVTDEEMLDAALNANFAGGVNGSIGIFSASAQDNLGLNVSHHFSSKDDLYVARASISNGAVYAVPKVTKPTSFFKDGKQGVYPATSVKLADWASTLKPDEFRKKCGTGFVSSIISGADLYVLFHFHQKNSEDRAKLNQEGKAGFGIGNLFGAKGSDSISISLDKALTEKTVEIHFAEQGGKIDTVPVDFATVSETVKKLGKAAQEGPRPIYMIVTFYRDLPECGKPCKSLSEEDILEKAVRYRERLASAYFEGLNIRGNMKRDRGPVADCVGNC